ncbi:uncharacterized protein LOC118406968 [Branchiostoma floridae]|nr:uncharacterized protein LOC118406968 [Branchiostoma floridae]
MREALPPESGFFTALEVQPHPEEEEATPGQHLTPQSLAMDVLARPYSYDTRAEFVSSLIVSKEQVAALEKATRAQSNSPIWSMARQGRITASNFYKIYTRVQTIKSNPEESTDSLLGTIMGYKRVSENVRALKYGRTMEEEAKAALFQQFSQEHEDARCEQKGLVISEHKAYLGASPDALFTCKCHGQQVVEIKCPIRCKDAVPSISNVDYLYESSTGGVQLKQKNAYYAQCQGQMALTGCRACIFYVYSKHGSISINIAFDSQYWEDMCAALDFFFVDHVAPELLTGKLKQKIESGDQGSGQSVGTDQASCSTSTSSSSQTASNTPSRNHSSQAASPQGPAMCPVCASLCIEDVRKFGDGSVGCDSCGKWYHFRCIGLKTSRQVKKLPDCWQCSTCRGKV